MPPDLNSLPTSRPPSLPGSPLSQRPHTVTDSMSSPPSPRSSTALQSATTNLNIQHSPSRISPLERRRSSLMNSLTSMNDSTTPVSGELQISNSAHSGSPRPGRRSFALPTADPHHQRQPSLGELHQELENEQEAQVNRLLNMIRLQQDQLASIQRQDQHETSSSVVDQGQSPLSPLGLPTPAGTIVAEHLSPRLGSSPHTQFNRPHSLSRQSSSRLSNTGPNSRSGSPSLRPQSSSLGAGTEDFMLAGPRDDSAFYQAETQMLTRENQMLKLRIRELERQVSDMESPAAATPL